MKPQRNPNFGANKGAAICIDQESLDERAEQVSMMSRIYHSSVGNLVYLGEGDSCTDAAIQSVQAIALRIQREIPDSDSFRAIMLKTEGICHHTKDDLPREVDVAALAYLFALPYFSYGV